MFEQMLEYMGEMLISKELIRIKGHSMSNFREPLNSNLRDAYRGATRRSPQELLSHINGIKREIDYSRGDDYVPLTMEYFQNLFQETPQPEPVRTDTVQDITTSEEF